MLPCKDQERGCKVKLINDSTRYHKSLKVGVEGVTVGRQDVWSRGSQNRFITVKFPEVTLDILWINLEEK
jgi:hypothetical protein